MMDAKLMYKAKYLRKAEAATPGTNGADPAFWERVDQAQAIITAIPGLQSYVEAVEIQPLSYVIFLLEKYLENLRRRPDLADWVERADRVQKAVDDLYAL